MNAVAANAILDEQNANTAIAMLDNADPRPLMQVDALCWAKYSGIQLADGPFVTVGRHYQFEPLQSDAQRIAVRKATQGGWTQIFVLRSFHRSIYKYYQKGVLYLFPTDRVTTDFSASRYKPLITDNPDAIGRYVTDTNRENLKRIGGAHLYFRGGRLTKDKQSGSGQSVLLTNIPVDCFILDEYNLMQEQVRSLAKGRFEDSDLKEEVYLGNPTLPDHGIDRVYEQESDRRIWLIKCDHCGKETCLELEFPNCLKKRLDDTVYRACVHCGKEIFVDKGHWYARNPERSDYMHGYTNSHLIQPKTDLTQMLYDWEHLGEAQNVSQATTDFHNLKLGMSYVAAENKLTINDIYRVCTMEPMRERHWGPCGMGVDVHSDLLYVVIGFRPAEVGLTICKVARVSNFNDVYDLAKRFNVTTCVIEREPEIRKVREFIDAVPFECFACDYQEQQRHAAAYNEKENLVVINRTEMCDASHHLITEPGRVELPRIDTEMKIYAQEMSNIAKVLETDEETGHRKYFYRKLGSGRADHYRHATNFFMLAIDRVGVSERDHELNRPKDAWDDAFNPDYDENRGGWMAW